MTIMNGSLKQAVKEKLAESTNHSERNLKRLWQNRYNLLRRSEPLKTIEEIKKMLEKEFPSSGLEIGENGTFSRSGRGGDRRSAKMLKNKTNKV